MLYVCIHMSVLLNIIIPLFSQQISELLSYAMYQTMNSR